MADGVPASYGVQRERSTVAHRPHTVLGTDPTVRVGDPASVIAPGEGRCSRSGL